MSDEKKPAKKKAPAKKAKAPEKKGDIRIAIGAKTKLDSEKGVEDWSLEGIEINHKGDRIAVAYLNAADLFKLGWVRRKY
jgi:hypothetical protein